MIKTNKFGTLGVYTSIPQKNNNGVHELDKEIFHFSLKDKIKYYPKDYSIPNVY